LKTRIISILILAGSIAFIALSYEPNPVLDAKKLDANNISTWFRNNGSFNYDPFNNQYPGFEWPKGSGLFARFASGMWLGARIGNDTLVAVVTYAFEYLPGYTDNNGVPQGQNDPLYRMYRLTLGVNDADRMNWPNSLLGNSNQGAPVYFDTQTNSWKPLDFGHQTLFYRYTDSYPASHTVEGGSTAPLKADIMKLDFSVDVPGGLADAAFSQFTVINRSTQTWNNMYFTFWTDDDLGFANDDKVGCDSARDFGYTYNNTNNDPIYGNAPPAVGFLMLRGALFYTGNNNDTVYICRNKNRIARIGYKDSRMSVYNLNSGSNDPEWGSPRTFRESYRFMSGYKRNGTFIINPVGNYITKYVYSGDPVTGQGWIQSVQNDQKFMMSTGPVNMNPGDTQVIVIAQVIARGTSNLNSITRLRELSEVVKNYYNTCYTSPPIGIEPLSNELPAKFQLYQNFPNPFNPVTKIKFDIPSNVKRETSNAKIIIYDVLGREVATLVNEKLKPGTYEVEWDGTNYPSGVYYYRLVAGDFSETKKMVLIK
jgi:type IX secretion system substrate protein